MYNTSIIRFVLSMVMCFSLLSVHARAEQSSVAEVSSETSAETTSNESVNATEPTNTNAASFNYVETARDGELGKNIAEMAPQLTKAASDKVDWVADVASRIQLHGYAQGWYFYQHAKNSKGEYDNTNTFLCKRVLFWANAQITKRWSFLFMHDFSSVVQEYYTDFRVTRNNALTVRFGQFKNCLSYENPLSPTAMETIDVYSEGVTYLTGCGSDPLNGVQYGRDQGISLYGETNNKKFRYEVQVVNGSGINQKDKNNQKDVIMRLEVRPLKGLNICATGQLGTGNALIGNTLEKDANGNTVLNTSGQAIFNPGMLKGENYTRNRFTVGFDYKSRPFNVHGEYLEGKDGSVVSRGAYLTGSVPLYKKLELVASYDFFNFNVDQKRDMHKIVAGLQYWFFKKCRFQAQYVYKNASTDYKTYFSHGANHMIMCQMQVRFN